MGSLGHAGACYKKNGVFIPIFRFLYSKIRRLTQYLHYLPNIYGERPQGTTGNFIVGGARGTNGEGGAQYVFFDAAE